MSPSSHSFSTDTILSLLLSLLMLLVSCTSSNDLPLRHVTHISHLDLSESMMVRFSAESVENYRALLLDPANQQIIVGASDNVFRLDQKDLQLLERLDWPAPANSRRLCILKGQSITACRNHVLILHQIPSLYHQSTSPHQLRSSNFNDTELLICATGAFQPHCSRRHKLALDIRIADESAAAVCPHSPHFSFTTLVTSENQFMSFPQEKKRNKSMAKNNRGKKRINVKKNLNFTDHRTMYKSDLHKTSPGVLFAATSADFSGHDSVIYRHASNSRRMLRTNKFDSRRLNLPHFVSSFETSNHVYFLFTENALEHAVCGKTQVARLARVCKDDEGTMSGSGAAAGDADWTTFLKARIVCSLPDTNYPFYFEQVQSANYLADEQLLYVVFSTAENSVSGSAVCAYSLAAIESAFNGPVTYRASETDAWKTVHVNMDHFQCDATRPPPAMSSYQLKQMSLYSLMKKSVLPDAGTPIYRIDGVRLSLSSIDVVTTEHSKTVHVIYIADVLGTVIKLAVPSHRSRACLLLTMTLFDRTANVQSMKLLHDTGSLYIGTSEEIVKVSLTLCDSLRTRAVCLTAGYPYCDWREARSVCLPHSVGGVLSKQSPSSFPSDWPSSDEVCSQMFSPPTQYSTKLGTYQYQWSEWSDWNDCSEVSAVDTIDSGKGQCWCRQRRCYVPSSLLPVEKTISSGNCHGESVQVTNCTRHGGWSSWSAWSACSGAGRGGGVQRRHRTCSHPAPSHGGRQCVGHSIQKLFCRHRPPTNCRPPRHSSVNSINNSTRSSKNHQLPSVLTLWSSWSSCSAPCGGGFSYRRRQLLSDSSSEGHKVDERSGQQCSVEYKQCNTHLCPITSHHSEWSEWRSLRAHKTSIPVDGIYTTGAPPNIQHSSAYRRSRFVCSGKIADSSLLWLSTEMEDSAECPADQKMCNIEQSAVLSESAFTLYHLILASALSLGIGSAVTVLLFHSCRAHTDGQLSALSTLCSKLHARRHFISVSHEDRKCQYSEQTSNFCCPSSRQKKRNCPGKHDSYPATSLRELAEKRSQFPEAQPGYTQVASTFREDCRNKRQMCSLCDDNDLKFNLKSDSIF